MLPPEQQRQQFTTPNIIRLVRFINNDSQKRINLMNKGNANLLTNCVLPGLPSQRPSQDRI
jgi:hypothetical protein